MIIASQNTEQGNFNIAPSGTHVARCIQVIDLGTHHDEYQGKPKTQRKIRVNFELPDEKYVFDEKQGEQPYFVGVDYTLSLSEKANLRKDLESWRGKPFTEDELEGFDVSKLIGVPAMVSIIHRKAASGKEYPKITSITRLPKGMTCPEQINPSLEFSTADLQTPKFKELPQWIQDKIKESDEFKNLSTNRNSEGVKVTDEDGEEIPF